MRFIIQNMNDEDIKKIGDEFIKVLTPFSDSLDRIEQRMDKFENRMDKLDQRMNTIENRFGEVEDKVDALIVDVFHLQQKSDAMYDRIISVEDKLTHHIQDERDNLNEVRAHVGMPTLK